MSESILALRIRLLLTEMLQLTKTDATITLYWGPQGPYLGSNADETNSQSIQLCNHWQLQRCPRTPDSLDALAEWLALHIESDNPEIRNGILALLMVPEPPEGSKMHKRIFGS